MPGSGALRQQGADRFALIQAESRDVDEADDVRRIRAQGSDDLTAVGVAGDEGRAVLAGQHLTQPGSRAAAWVPVGRGERDPQRVAGHKRVRQIEFTDHIPRSLAGKILRRLLAAEGDPAVTGFLPGG